MAQYTVTAPLVSAYSVDGRCLYFYSGASLDDAGLRAGEAARLADAELIIADELPADSAKRRVRKGADDVPVGSAVVADGAVVFDGGDAAAAVKG